MILLEKITVCKLEITYKETPVYEQSWHWNFRFRFYQRKRRVILLWYIHTPNIVRSELAVISYEEDLNKTSRGDKANFSEFYLA